MSALSLPKNLLSRLSEMAGLVTTTEEQGIGDREQETVPEEEKRRGDDAPSSSPLSELPDVALVLSLDGLSPRELALSALACSRLRDVACSGDAWRLRFEPRLPPPVVARLDDAEAVRRRATEATEATEATTTTTTSATTEASKTSSPSSPPCSHGWPSTYAALALSNLLRSPLEWDGVSQGMRASYYRSEELDEGVPTSSAPSPPWRVTCHGGHGWEVEREGPAGADEGVVAPRCPSSSEGDGRSAWPPELLPRSSLSPSSRFVPRSDPRSSSWLLRSLRAPVDRSSALSTPPPPRPLSIASSFSWCEVVQEVDLVFELCRATSWIEESVRGGSDGGGGGSVGGGGGSDGGEDQRPRSQKTRSLSWTRQDAESYLDGSSLSEPGDSSPRPKLVLSFSCASRRDCESQLSAQLLALPGASETGPLPPYHGRPGYDWAARAKALAVSELPERAAPWDERAGVGGKGRWSRMTLSPLELPPGARRALVVFRSKDSRFWSGHYGAKIAAPVLAFAATRAEVEAAEVAARETEEAWEEAAAGRELLFAP